MHFFSDFFNSLDAVSYFLVNGGVVIAITAAIFFTFGLLFGALTWARYRKRWHRSEAANEALKADNSQLKRRLADMATRTLQTSAHLPVRTKYVPVILPPAVTASNSSAPATAFTPRSAAFTIWTEEVPREQKTSPTSAPEIPRGSLNGSKPNGHIPANDSGDLAHPFRGELESGRARHDQLLGIIFDEHPKRSDDLTKIKGINTACRNSLRAEGIFTYKQIALWTPVQIGEFARRLSLDARIQTDRWVDQARQLHAKKHGEQI